MFAVGTFFFCYFSFICFIRSHYQFTPSENKLQISMRWCGVFSIVGYACSRRVGRRRCGERRQQMLRSDLWLKLNCSPGHRWWSLQIHVAVIQNEWNWWWNIGTMAEHATLESTPLRHWRRKYASTSYSFPVLQDWRRCFWFEYMWKTQCTSCTRNHGKQ